jgi:hypothetical protein
MYGSAAILAEFEAHSIIELLAHCLRARAKEGIGGYSAATFNLKGVLFAIKCILSDPMNRRLFAATGNASRLNALLIKAVSNYSQYDVSNILDAQAAEHAILSIYHMTLHGLDEKELGFSSSLANGVFLPSTYGDLEGKTMLIMILRSYLTNRDKATLKGIYATDQILYRLSYLRFEGCVEDLVCISRAIVLCLIVNCVQVLLIVYPFPYRPIKESNHQPKQTLIWMRRFLVTSRVLKII